MEKAEVTWWQSPPKVVKKVVIYNATGMHEIVAMS